MDLRRLSILLFLPIDPKRHNESGNSKQTVEPNNKQVKEILSFVCHRKISWIRQFLFKRSTPPREDILRPSIILAEGRPIGQTALRPHEGKSHLLPDIASGSTRTAGVSKTRYNIELSSAADHAQVEVPYEPGPAVPHALQGDCSNDLLDCSICYSELQSLQESARPRLLLLNP